MPILEGFRTPWNGEMPKVRLLLSKTKIGFRRMPSREVVKKSLSGFRKALLYLVVMKFYFLLRYAAKANASAPKIAATVVGSGTLMEMDNSFALIA